MGYESPNLSPGSFRDFPECRRCSAHGLQIKKRRGSRSSEEKKTKDLFFLKNHAQTSFFFITQKKGAPELVVCSQVLPNKLRPCTTENCEINRKFKKCIVINSFNKSFIIVRKRLHKKQYMSTNCVEQLQAA